MSNAVTPPDLIFEERAENLSKSDLHKWTILSEAEKKIVRKLVGPGAKLLSGPRGSGKSTLFRIAFYEAAKTKSAFAVYVNYSKALAVEPLFHSHADAAVLFRQWVLAKIVVAVQEAAALWKLQLSPSEKLLIDNAGDFIRALEAGVSPSQSLNLSPSGLTEALVDLCSRAGVARTVLLLDDAAHAFSVKQQREFFELFRELRSRQVSGKAAIYPGVTSFSPTFHVGHEAELIEAWFRPDEPGFLETMRQVVKARFPTFSPKDSSVIDAIALASFGLPRGFLNLCYEIHEAGQTSSARAKLVDVVNVHADLVRTVFSNIADRLPRFANFIELGKKFDRRAVDALREYNEGKDVRHKSATIALSEPVDATLERVLRFMEYAGLVRAVEGTLSKGEKGRYKRYLIHYGLLVGSGALSLGRSYKVSDIVLALQKPNAHALVKSKADTLLGVGFESGCVLALPPCPNCGTNRHTEEQKFCMTCGQELRAASVYNDLMNASIEKLPLPRRKVTALRQQGFSTIRELLADETQSFRKPGSSIGPVWAKRIMTAAEEWVSV